MAEEQVAPETFDEALTKFVADAQKLVDDYMLAHFPRNPTIALSVMRGARYMRIVAADSDGSSRRVYCFVDSTNGDILKAAGWKAPAKGARGNIYTYKDVSECVNNCGAHYR